MTNTSVTLFPVLKSVTCAGLAPVELDASAVDHASAVDYHKLALLFKLHACHTQCCSRLLRHPWHLTTG